MQRSHFGDDKNIHTLEVVVYISTEPPSSPFFFCFRRLLARGASEASLTWEAESSIREKTEPGETSNIMRNATKNKSFRRLCVLTVLRSLEWISLLNDTSEGVLLRTPELPCAQYGIPKYYLIDVWCFCRAASGALRLLSTVGVHRLFVWRFGLLFGGSWSG